MPPRRSLAAVVALTAGCLLPGTASADPGTGTGSPVMPTTPRATNVLAKHGAQLLLNGQPFKFTGVNAFTLTGCGDARIVPTVAQMEAFFAGLRPNSLVRTWAFAGMDLARIDQVVALARAHNVRLILTLADAQGGCADPGGEKRADDWYRSGWRSTVDPWIRTLVPRYAEDPTIAMWDLINEPLGGADAVRSYLDSAGALVRTLDEQHLITVGTMGDFQGDDWFRTQVASPYVDVVQVHGYGNPPDKIENARAVDKTLPVGKPLIVGEWGVQGSPTGAGDSGSYHQDARTWAARATEVRTQVTTELGRPGVAGALYWDWLPNCPQGADLAVCPGDPTMGTLRTVPVPDMPSVPVSTSRLSPAAEPQPSPVTATVR